MPEAFQKDHFVGFHGNRAFLRAMVMLRTFPAPKGIIGIDFKNEMTAHGVLFGSALSCDCQSGRWSVVGGTLDCHTRYVARWTPANINNLEYGSANWCSAGYRMVGWDTRGADGRTVSGGEVGNINSWAFCCRMQ